MELIRPLRSSALSSALWRRLGSSLAKPAAGLALAAFAVASHAADVKPLKFGTVVFIGTGSF